MRRRLRAAAISVWIGLFTCGLAAAAPHSVHHIGHEKDARPAECPGVAAWSFASAADCPAIDALIVTPLRPLSIVSVARCSPPILRPLARPGRAPPFTA